MRNVSRALVAGLAAAGLLLTACSSSSSSDTSDTTAGAGGDRLRVVAGLYPLAYAAEQVGGDAVDVVTLAAPGVEPHDLELSATQVAQIAEADLVLYVKGLQPAVDEAIAQEAPDRAIDVTAGLTLLAGEHDHKGEEADHADEHADEDGHEGEEHAEEDGHDHATADGSDPHVWLAPKNLAAIGQAIAERLDSLDPDAAADIDARATDLDARMTALDTEFHDGLANCTVRDLVVSHEAFGYLANAYGFTQLGLSGLDPEAEPSPARLKEVADLVRAEGIDTIYYETLVSPKVAETIAAETGARTAVLDPIEGLAVDATGDYETIMRANLAALQEGQHCT